jgi:hypothetical protein
MKNDMPLRDERTVAVENASYRWGFNLLAFGSLAIVAYRGFLFQENLWDLLVLVIAASGLSTLYQARAKLFTRRTFVWMAVIGACSAVLAVFIVLLAARLQSSP